MTDAQCWMMPNTRKNGGDSREGQVHTLVREFYEIRKSQEIPVIAPRMPLRRRPIVAVITIVLCVAAWLVPQIIASSSAAPSEESLQRNARLAIYIASLTVRTHQRQSGRMPATARQAGLEDSSIAYQRLSDSTFELSKEVGDAIVSYNSTSNIAFFLRNDSVLARKY